MWRTGVKSIWQTLDLVGAGFRLGLTPAARHQQAKPRHFTEQLLWLVGQGWGGWGGGGGPPLHFTEQFASLFLAFTHKPCVDSQLWLPGSTRGLGFGYIVSSLACNYGF